MELDKLAKYKTSLEEYDKFLKRLRHIAAVFLGYPVEEEPCILINGSSPRYEKQTGLISFGGYINDSSSRYEKPSELINFDGHLRRFAGSEVELDITCPFSFVDSASDEEISSRIQSIIDKQKQASKDKNSIDGRIRHVTAVLLDSTYSEPFIIVNYDTFEYVKGSGDIHFKGSIVYGTGGPCNEIDISFPFHFLRGGTDEEIIKWRDNLKHDEQKLDEPRFPVERVLEIGRNFQNEDKWHGAHWDTVKLLCDTIEWLQGKLQGRQGNSQQGSC